MSRALAVGATSTPAHAARVATQAHIVIAGSGLGGLALAHRLSKMLDGAKITLIDAKEEHNYQPGCTLVATGVWPLSQVIDHNADFMPAGVEWVNDMVAEFDPAANAVVTASGQRIAYDYLVVAVGTHQDWALIKGMDVKAIGQNGLTRVYPSSGAAVATWTAMDAFRKKGGKAVMPLPATALKCAGAPLKMTFMLRDRLAQSGTLDQSEVMFYSALGSGAGCAGDRGGVPHRARTHALLHGQHGLLGGLGQPGIRGAGAGSGGDGVFLALAGAVHRSGTQGLRRLRDTVALF